jgi:hypothetical protein
MNMSDTPQTIAEIKERALAIFESAFERADWFTLREARDTLRKSVCDVAAEIEVMSFMVKNPDVWELASLSMNGFQPTLRGVVIEAIATNIVRDMPGFAQDRFNSQFDTRLDAVLKSLVDDAVASYQRRPGTGEEGHELYNSLCGLKISLERGLDRELVQDAIEVLSDFRDLLPNVESFGIGRRANAYMSTVDSLKTVLSEQKKLDEMFSSHAPSM